MRKNNSSMKSMNFIKRNSLNYDGCKSYVSELLLKVFNINTFKFDKYIDDEIALFLNINNQYFILYIDYEYVELKVKHDDNIRVFRKDSCWMNALQWCIDKGDNYGA